MRKSLLGSVCLASLLYADTSVYELGRIEVADTNDISQNKTIEIVDSEVIEDTNSKNVVEALSTLPGVSVQKLGRKNQTDVRIRGFTSEFIPIYIDGIPVYTPYDRGTDLGRYTTFDVSEISVSKGYVSPMFGANTLGGAVNIVTKKPTKEFEGEIGIGAFSGNGKEQYLKLGTNQGLFYGLLSVSNYERDYFNISDDFKASGMEDGDHRDNADSKDRKVNVKVGFTPNETDEYSFNYIRQRAEKGNPEYASDYVGGDEGARWGWRNRTWRWDDWDKTSYYFISKTVFDRLTVKTRAFYDEFYNKLVAYDDDTYTVIDWTSEYDDYTVGANIELSYVIDKNQNIKASIMRKNDYHTDISSGEKDIDVEGRTDSFGLEYSLKATDKLKWVVGASYDENKILKAEYRDGNNIGQYDNHSNDAVSPQTALYYQFDDNTMIYTAIGQRTNMPSMNQRYSTSFGNMTPNPDLDAEKSMNYEIGFEHILNQQHSIKNAIFYSKTKDFIDSVDIGGGQDQNQNIGEVEQKGLDLSVDSYWNDVLSTNIAYGYVKPKLLKNVDPDVKYITRIPKHTFSLRLKYQPTSKLEIIPSLRYESDRYVDNTDSRVTTKDFTVMNLKVNYEIQKDIELSAGINNITDKYYYYTEGQPEAGRNYYANLRYKF